MNYTEYNDLLQLIAAKTTYFTQNYMFLELLFGFYRTPTGLCTLSCMYALYEVSHWPIFIVAKVLQSMQNSVTYFCLMESLRSKPHTVSFFFLESKPHRQRPEF
jgi:hypothetical protein